MRACGVLSGRLAAGLVENPSWAAILITVRDCEGLARLTTALLSRNSSLAAHAATVLMVACRECVSVCRLDAVSSLPANDTERALAECLEACAFCSRAVAPLAQAEAA